MGQDLTTDLERIRQASDIVEVVGEHLALKRAGSAFKGLCPFHNEKTPSFNVSPARQSFKCFGCGAGGDVFKFVQLRENVGFAEAIRLLADRAGINLPDRRSKTPAQDPDRATLIRANEWAARWFGEQLRHPKNGAVAREYVQSRRFDPQVADGFGIGFAPGSYDRIIHDAASAHIPIPVLQAAGLTRNNEAGTHYAVFRNRLMFAIRDSSGRIIGFGGRALDDSPAKYLNTPETVLFDKGRHVFGLDRARESIAEKGRVVVVEGYTDCLMAHQFGFRETVAALGTSFTAQQARLLARFCKEVILVFDSDEAGQRASDRALEAALAQRLTVRLASVPEGKDPCDFLLSAGPERFEALLNSAPDALEFKWHQVRSHTNAPGGATDSHRLVEEFLGLVARCVARESFDTVHLGFIANQVGKLLGLPANEIYRYITKRRDRELRRPDRGDEATLEQVMLEPANADQAAVRHVLEVLLNAPECVELISDRRLVEQVDDSNLARIAGEFLSAYPDGRGFSLAAFLSAFEEPEMTALITDMQLAGERRGNYEATLRGALDCLELERRTRGYQRWGPKVESSGTAWLKEVSLGTESRHHFVPKRHKEPLVSQAAILQEGQAARETDAPATT